MISRERGGCKNNSWKRTVICGRNMIMVLNALRKCCRKGVLGMRGWLQEFKSIALVFTVSVSCSWSRMENGEPGKFPESGI